MVTPSHLDRVEYPPTGRCFHCNEPIPDAVQITAIVAGKNHSVCCYGCRAVAEMIAAAGLNDYYTYRTAPATKQADDTDRNAWRDYDRDTLLTQLTRVERDGSRSATIGLEGLGCAACAWLIDRMLAREPGIRSVHTDIATARVSVNWDATVRFSAILERVNTLGYKPYPLEPSAIENARRYEVRGALKRLAVAGLGMMQVMMFAVGLYDEASMDAMSKTFLREVSLLCTLPVLLYSGAPILRNAWRAIVARTVVMDVSVATALLLAFGASVWNTWFDRGTVYYDSVVMFVFFLTLGRFVEMEARYRTGTVTDALAKILPRMAHAVGDDGAIVSKPVSELNVGERVLIRPGEAIPADGKVISGHPRIDESMLSGESQAIARGPGDSVMAGSINTSTAFYMRVTAMGQEMLLSHIVRLLDGGRSKKPAALQFADKAASWFLSRILFGAGVVAAAWLIVDPTRAFDAVLAVLVVTCPCALSLAMPAARSAAIAALARRGILIIKPDALESLAATSTIVFDKTGTLTESQAHVDQVAAFSKITPTRAMQLAAALERHSEHPIARAFNQIACDKIEVTDSVATPGAGIEGVIDGRRYRIGEQRFAAPLDAVAHGSDENWIYLGEDGYCLAAFRITDRIRGEAAATMSSLADRNVRVEMISGDSQTAVARTAAVCGIERFKARQLPAEKLTHVCQLSARGETVTMVGDGINDAPVLAAAATSIAMGSGSALAQSSADVLLVRDSLHAIPEAIDIARRTQTIVRQNLIWAAAYNFVALPLAALGFIPPWLAAIGMSASSIAVVANALRLAPRRSGKRRIDTNLLTDRNTSPIDAAAVKTA